MTFEDDRAKSSEARETKITASADKLDSTSERLFGGVRLLIWMSAILGVLLAGNLLRSYYLEEHLDQTESAVDDLTVIASGAKTSSDAALEELRAAIRAIKDANAAEPDLQNQAIIDALEAVARIEAFICGGVCPEPGT